MDRLSDLLLGLIALKHELISAAELVAAFDAWTGSSDRSMTEIFVGQGSLDEAGCAQLEKLAASQIEKRGGGTPAEERGKRRVRASLKTEAEREDSDPAATVAYVPPDARGDRGASEQAPGAAGVQRFRILRPHARGGLGEVFIALDPELNREVALKELQAKRAYDPMSQSRFLLEAEVTGRLEHPGVVPVYGLGRYGDGRPFYAMRFIEGETLKSAIDRFHNPGSPAPAASDRQIAFRRLLRSVIDACNAVAYAHSRGVVHRDLKPENIMLGRFGETLVVDWGMAKPLAEPERHTAEPMSLSKLADEASLTLQGTIVGTPQYMSPEQAAGDQERVGPASDIYSLGATLYTVLVGRAPFVDGEVRNIVQRVRRGVFAAPRRLRKSVDPALEAICLKAMSLRPEERPASALELAADLEGWLADVRYRGEQEQALNQVKRSLASLCFERAQNFFGREMHGHGMLWLARALENVPPDCPSLERVVRASLCAWHLGAKQLERVFPHRGQVCAIALSADGRRLATACDDHKGRLWDLAKGTQLSQPMTHGGPVRAIAFSPDGSIIVTAGDDGSMRRWDALSGEPLEGASDHKAPIASARFSPDGSLIATLGEGGTLRLWETSSGDAVEFAAERELRVRTFAFSADGSRLAAAGDDGGVWLWAAATGKRLGEALSQSAPVCSLDFRPDGAALLCAGVDGTARLWELESASPVKTFEHQSEVCCVRFNPASQSIATACQDGTARLWDAGTGQPIGETIVHRGRVNCVEFSADGAMLALASRDGTVSLWDAATSLPIGPRLTHPGDVNALAISTDEQRLATACTDGSARCWKVATPVAGDSERISCWVRVETGLDFDAGDSIRRIDNLTNLELRRKLLDLGGPPIK
jgi:WD40 repeat protein/serine/threonine protein kinase